MIYPKTIIFSFSLLLCCSLGFAQNYHADFSFETAGETYSDNSVEYKIELVNDGVRSALTNKSSNIDLSGSTKAQIEITFFNLNLDKSLDGDYKKTASLGAIKPWIKASCCLMLTGKRDLFIKQSESSSLVFEINSNGTGSFNIGYGIKAEGESKRSFKKTAKPIEYNYVVSGYDPDAVAEDAQESSTQEPASANPTAKDDPKDELAALNEEASKRWFSIRKTNQTATLYKFIEDFPGTDYVIEAQKALESLDARAWTKAEKRNTLSGYKYYLKKFPNGAKKEVANERIKGMEQEVAFNNSNRQNNTTSSNQEKEATSNTSNEKDESASEEDMPGEILDTSNIAERFSVILDKKLNDTYTYSLQNANKPQIDYTSLSNEEFDNLDFEDAYLQSLKKFKVKVLNPGQYTFSIIDESGAKQIIEIDNKLTASILQDPDFAAYAIKMENGTLPYSIKFYNEQGLDTAEFSNLSQDSLSIPFADIYAQDIDGGDISAIVSDTRLNSKINIGDLHLPKEEGSGIQQYLIYAGIAILALIGFLFMRKKQKGKKQVKDKFQALKDASDKAFTENPVAAVPVVDNNIKAKPKSQSKSQIVAPVKKPGKSSRKGESRIKIHKNAEGHNRRKQMDFEEFQEMIDDGAYLILDLEGLWESSAISEIMIEQGFAGQLDKFLREENLDMIIDEEAGNTPEVGGFLMGRYSKDPETHQFQISLNEFVPIVPEDNNVFSLEFSTNSLVRELGDAQDVFPDLSVIGWFHTHPGHGLFLSKPDMTIHRGFFKENYQVAMEIDSLSERLDTGFFTQRMNGEMNNSIYKRPSWFSWRDIEKTLL